MTLAEAEASQGRYTSANVVWHWPVALLIESPRLGDQVVDAAGTVWTVLEVQQATVGTRWRCLDEKPGVGRRAEFVHHDRAGRVRQERGRLLEPPLDRGMVRRVGTDPARPRTAARRPGPASNRPPLSDHGRRGAAVDSTHRVLAADGSAYRIVGVERSERIDQLPVLLTDARRPWKRTVQP